MYDKAKVKAFSDFHELLVTREARMNVQEQYVELLRLADGYFAKGVISLDERRSLIEVATMAYARAVEGVGAGT